MEAAPRHGRRPHVLWWPEPWQWHDQARTRQGPPRPLPRREHKGALRHAGRCRGRRARHGARRGVQHILFSEDVADLHVLQQGGHGELLFKDLMVGVLEDWTKPNVSDAFPFLAPIDLLGSRRRVSGALTKLYKFFDDEFIERRRLASSCDENHGDLLDVVLARYAKSEITRSQITKFFTVRMHAYTCLLKCCLFASSLHNLIMFPFFSDL